MVFQDIFVLKIRHFHGVLGKKPYFGNISNNYIGEYNLLRLEFAFIASLSLDKYAAFTFKGNAIRTLRYGEEYLEFNSHCRNEQGFCSSKGTSILVIKNDVTDFSVQVRSLFMSLTSDEDSLNEQLELHWLNMIKISASSVARYRRKGIKVCNVPNDVDNSRQISSL